MEQKIESYRKFVNSTIKETWANGLISDAFSNQS